MKLNLSNPRRHAVIPDWPLGRDKRGPATFQVHTDPRRGERVSRTMTGKPTFTTYGSRMAIVDGDNGKTYLLQQMPGSVHIIAGDCHHDAPGEETGRDSAYVWAHNAEDSTLYQQLVDLLRTAG